MPPASRAVPLWPATATVAHGCCPARPGNRNGGPQMLLPRQRWPTVAVCPPPPDRIAGPSLRFWPAKPPPAGLDGHPCAFATRVAGAPDFAHSGRSADHDDRRPGGNAQRLTAVERFALATRPRGVDEYLPAITPLLGQNP